MKNKYNKQNRGDISAYEKYFAGMNASMQQKIALTTAHFPSRGKIADMGSGSGSGTFDLARLYEDLNVIGIDINPVTVDYSNKKFQAKNLKYIVGDIAEKILENDSLEGILNSSVLHHVTSFNEYDIRQISKTLDNQVAQLKTGGVLIIRDFVVPDEAEKPVCLDLPTNDGNLTGEIPELSTAALFKIFARDFRSSLNMSKSFLYKTFKSPQENFLRFQTTLRYATEFVLRKDYRRDWATELIEEYTYYSQIDFENSFRRKNLRIVVSMPLWNPWIVSNRFVDKFYLSDSEENPLTYPPTNFLIVGEKVGKNDGVQIFEKTKENADFKFLKLKAYQHRETGQIFELAERPNQTIDLLPWFENKNGQIFILAKKDFPRPIVNAQLERRHLNRANYSGYLTEPINAIVQSSEFRVQSSIEKILAERGNLIKDEILNISEANFYFPSPGGVDEWVESYLVKIKDWKKEPQEIENYTQFASAGFVRELDALQVLRSCAVGGMFDARLEINTYRLLRELKRSASVWIGEEIKPTAQNLPDDLRVSGIEELTPEKREMFSSIEFQENNFLKLKRSEFIEENSEQKQMAKAEFEYVVPKNFSKNTVAAIPFVKTADETFVGIEFRDLPAPQRFTGSSHLACVPAWRLPFEVKHKFDLESFLQERLPIDFYVEANKFWELGGSFFTSAGITPEVVYPLAVELKTVDLAKADLRFFKIENLLDNSDKIQDAHLLILLNRLAHALGFLTMN
jgi:ubiquinone/menaquinone biosynthesis C-methylase UbiE